MIGKQHEDNVPSVIVCSALDPAGLNIRDRLIESFQFEKTSRIYSSNPILSLNDGVYLGTTQNEIVKDDEELDSVFGDCRYIFVSRHRSEKGIPSLTAHFPGNLGDSTLGGRAREISRYSPALLKAYMQSVSLMASDLEGSYEITLEATHHGPTSLRSPVMFVELGSAASQWEDKNAAEHVARALIASLREVKKPEKCFIAIGGTHYPQKFNKFVLNTDFGLGTIIPKYSLEFLDSQLLTQILEKSDQAISGALVDYKGLGQFKSKVLDLLREYRLDIIRV